jgi:hypothetical protein
MVAVVLMLVAMVVLEIRIKAVFLTVIAAAAPTAAAIRRSIVLPLLLLLLLLLRRRRQLWPLLLLLLLPAYKCVSVSALTAGRNIVGAVAVAACTPANSPAAAATAGGSVIAAAAAATSRGPASPSKTHVPATLLHGCCSCFCCCCCPSFFCSFRLQTFSIYISLNRRQACFCCFPCC